MNACAQIIKSQHFHLVQNLRSGGSFSSKVIKSYLTDVTMQHMIITKNEQAGSHTLD